MQSRFALNFASQDGDQFGSFLWEVLLHGDRGHQIIYQLRALVLSQIDCDLVRENEIVALDQFPKDLSNTIELVQLNKHTYEISPFIKLKSLVLFVHGLNTKLENLIPERAFLDIVR
jgi:hypothetical protein